jgi:uncharacterized protein YjiS (DUF1127 family)
MQHGEIAMEKIYKKMIKRWMLHARYRKTVKELTQLTDRDLADLGIHRSDIARVAKQSVLRQQVH